MSDWRAIAQRFNGTGLNGTIIDPELPLSNIVVTKSLSAPNTITGEISPGYARLVDSTGQLRLVEWGTIIIIENGTDIIGGIVNKVSIDDSSASVEVIGLAGYANGMPYTDAWFGVEVDPLDVLRQIWSHLQSKTRGNVGLEVDPLKTGLKIGNELEQVEFDTQSGPVSFEAGPIKLAWYQTHDLGQTVDELAEQTPFDYREHWFYDGNTVRARLELGYPALGRQRPESFVIGENVATVPPINTNPESYANEMLALGAGEGNAMARSITARVDATKVRRVAVVTDSSLRTNKAVQTLANAELAWRIGKDEVDQVIVRDTPQAPISALEPGDHISLQGDVGQAGEINDWFRIKSISINIDEGSVAQLDVERSDKAKELS